MSTSIGDRLRPREGPDARIAALCHPLRPSSSSAARVATIDEVIAVASPARTGSPWARRRRPAMRLTAALFTQKADIRIRLAYRGSGPVADDVLGGHIALGVLDIPSFLQLIRGGHIKALAVSSTKRVATLPEVPTSAESGLKIRVRRLVRPCRACRNPACRRGDAQCRLRQGTQGPSVAEDESAGAGPAPTTPESFRQFIGSENAKSAKLIAEAGIKGVSRRLRSLHRPLAMSVGDCLDTALPGGIPDATHAAHVV